MNVECGICKDAYVNFQNLNAAPCGHVFHQTCISNWLNMGTLTCPQCRKPTSKKSILKLFFDMTVPEENAPEDVASLVGRNNCLKSEIMVLKSEISALQDKLRVTSSTVDGIKEMFLDAERKNTRLEHELIFQRDKTKHLEKIKKELMETKKLYELAKSENTRLQSFRSLNMTNVDEPELRDLSHLLSKEDLVQLICSSKREQKKLIRSECSLANDLSSANRENLKLRTKVENLESTNNTLQQIINGFKERDQQPSPSTSNQPNLENSFDAFLDSSAFINFKPEVTPPKLKFSLETTDKKVLGLNNRTIFKPPRVLKLTNPTNTKSSSDVDSKFYNGLGGTSKLDIFPKLRPCKIVSNKKMKK